MNIYYSEVEPHLDTVDLPPGVVSLSSSAVDEVFISDSTSVILSKLSQLQQQLSGVKQNNSSYTGLPQTNSCAGPPPTASKWNK